MIFLFFCVLFRNIEFIFEKLISHGLIISKKKLKLFKTQIEFLGLELEDGQIKLQDHIVQKINNFIYKLKDLRTLQSFLKLLNYVRPYIKNLSKLARPLYSKTKNTGHRYFNQEDIKLIQKNKGTCKTSPNFTFTLRK